jgi:hypothetical protein
MAAGGALLLILIGLAVAQGFSGQSDAEAGEEKSSATYEKISDKVEKTEAENEKDAATEAIV